MGHCTHPEGPARCKSETCPGRQAYRKLLKTGKNNPTFIEEETATSFTISEYFKTDYEPNAPQEVKDLAYSFMEYADEITIDNHCKHGPETVTLADMLDSPKLFNNNCGPLTWAVLEDLKHEAIEGYTFEEHVLQYKEGIHVAILAINSEGEEYVIDYTAKQYYEKLPCPIIETKENWEKTIDTYVSMLYNDERKNS